MCFLNVTLCYIKINSYLYAVEPWAIEMQCDIIESTKAGKSWIALHQTNHVATPLFYFTTDKTCDIIDLMNKKVYTTPDNNLRRKCLNN
jgi:hypothetical protein